MTELVYRKDRFTLVTKLHGKSTAFMTTESDLKLASNCSVSEVSLDMAVQGSTYLYFEPNINFNQGTLKIFQN